MLTQDRLKQVISYNKKSGVFRWKQNKGHMKVGERAGGLAPTGYVLIGIDGKRYLAHRLAWLYEYGVWPSKRIDHRDEKRSNNRIKNLREADHCENLWNITNRKNRIYPKGVSRNGNKYCSRIWVRRKCIWLGNFPTVGLASKAYIKASKELHGAFSIYHK